MARTDTTRDCSGLSTAAIALGLGLALGAGLTAPAADAQNRGQDPTAFTLTHFGGHGPWEVFCGQFAEEAAERCWIRYTDVYSPRPNFKAVVMNIVPSDRSDAGIRYDIGVEATDSWINGGITVGDWFLGLSRCLVGTCTVDGDTADALTAQWRDADETTIRFFELGVTRVELTWSTVEFAAALDDFQSAAAARGLVE